MIRKYLHQLLLIKEGEVSTVIYFLAFFLIIGFGMALGNATANTLFLKRFGIDFLPLVYPVQGVVCFVIMILYASFADIISSERFFKILFSLLAALILGFWAMITYNPAPLLFPAYFLFYEVVSEMLLVHCALYLNQNINILQAKRLSPIIFAGLQIGTVMGGLFLTAFAPFFGTSNILVIWLLLILLGLLLIVIRHKYIGSSPYYRAAREAKSELKRMGSNIQQGLRLTRNSDLLRVATITMVFMVITYYIISYSVKRVYTDSYAEEAELTAFFGALSTLTSSLALLTQLLLTNRLINRFGVPTINLLYPFTTFISILGMIFHTGLPAAIGASINIKTVMPAIHNPVRTMFLNVLPQKIQGRARAMTMAIVLPISLTISGIMLWFLQKLDNPIYILIPATFAAGLFFYFSLKMNRAYGKTLLDHLKEHLFLPDEQSAISLRSTGQENIDDMVRAIDRNDDFSVSSARILTRAYPEIAVGHILPAIERAPDNIADQLLNIVSTSNDPLIYSFLLENIEQHDNHFKANALKLLAKAHFDEAIPLIYQALDNPDPRIRATGIHCVLSWPLVQYQALSEETWLGMLNGNTNEQLSAIELIPQIRSLGSEDATRREQIEKSCINATTSIFDTLTTSSKVLVLSAYKYWQTRLPPQIQLLISESLTHTAPEIRSAAVNCVYLLPAEEQYPKIITALEDGHLRVRTTAVEVLCKKAADAQGLIMQWIDEDNRGSPRAQITLLNHILDTIPQASLESIIESKIQDARNIYVALITVQKHNLHDNHSLRLIEHLLEERFKQILEIALTAMEPLCDTYVISTIRAGLRTNDDRYIANACEALHSITHLKVTHSLGQMIQDAFMPPRLKTVAKADSIEVLLEKLMMRHDDWLHDCAEHSSELIKGNT